MKRTSHWEGQYWTVRDWLRFGAVTSAVFWTVSLTGLASNVGISSGDSFLIGIVGATFIACLASKPG
jgi:hypothetical protein